MPKNEIDIMNGPQNLYVNNRALSDIEIRKSYASVTFKKSNKTIGVSFDKIIWQSPLWNEVI